MVGSGPNWEEGEERKRKRNGLEEARFRMCRGGGNGKEEEG